MARRRSQRHSNIKSAERTLWFNLNPSNDTNIGLNNVYLDLAQVYSLANRISLRQGYAYAVESIEIGVQAGGAFEACIMRLPHHWPVWNAWEKAMTLWKKQQDDTAEEAGLESTIARYRDFKIHFDSSQNFAQNLIPEGYFIDDPLSTADVYEWSESRVVIPNDAVAGTTTERSLHMIGPDLISSAGIIQAYAESRSRPQVIDPNVVNTPTGGLFGEMFDVGMDDEDIVDNFQDTNHEPPYLLYRAVDAEAYPGGSYQGIGGQQFDGTIVDILSVNAGQNYNTDTCSGFVAPCGLIKLNYNATGVNVPGVPEVGQMPFGIFMKVTLAPGEYKGFMAKPMQEMN